MKIKLEQWQLNWLLGILSVVVIVLVVSSFLGVSPLEIAAWAGNMLVYSFFLLGFQVVLPVVLGYAVRRYPVEWADFKFGRQPGERIPNGLNLLLAVVVGLSLAIAWVWLTPRVAYIPSLSEWPWDSFKWAAGYEGMNWLVAGVCFVLAACGFGVGVMASDDLHKND